MDEVVKRTNKSLIGNVRSRFRWIKGRKLDILIIVIWSFLMALVFVRAYWFVYLENPKLVEYKILIFYADSIDRPWVPRLKLVDYVLIILINSIAGFLVIDAEKVVIEWLISSLLSFIFAITWAFLFMWYPLGAGEVFPGAFGLVNGASHVIQFAILNIFRMFFPFAPVCSFVASVIGAFIGERFRH